jgi:hypothetical protein
VIKQESVSQHAPAESQSQEMPKPDAETRPFIILIAIASVMILVAEFIVARTAPLELLVETTQWSVIGTMHGIAGGTVFLTSSISLYLGYRLLVGQVESFKDLQVVTSATAVTTFLTILLGNWIYIGYRAPGMVQDYFLQTQPVLHMMFFEFKEVIALFTFPLAAAAAFILIRYGDEMVHRPWLRTMVFLLVALVFAFFLITFGLGALITKIKPV